MLQTAAVLFVIIIGYSLAQDDCPTGWFNVAWIMAVDEIVTVDIFAQRFSDPNLTFFKDILLYGDEEIEEVTQKAINYFKRRFGLDFSQSSVTPQGFRIFENATMFPVRIPVTPVATYNRWVINGREGRTRCFNMREGGYQVTLTGNQVVHGTYGGEEGQVLTPAEELGYRVFSTNFCKHTPTVIQCAAINPLFRNPYGFAAVHLECFNEQLGRGLLTGAQGLLPTGDPNTIRLLVRHVVTFPATVVPGYLDEEGL